MNRMSEDLKCTVNAPFKSRVFINGLCFALVVIFAGLQSACLNSNRTANTEAGREEAQKKADAKMQREESLKLFYAKLEEFVKSSPPVKLASAPYLKGKTVIVNVDPDGRVKRSFYFGYELTEPESKLVYPDNLIFSSEKEIWSKNFGVKSIAEKADDVQTVIQLKFTDTNVCRSYVVAHDDKETEICGEKADVAVIDNTIPAIIAKKTFVNNKLPQKIKVSKGPVSDFYIQKDLYQMYPFQEIEDYLKSFEQR